MLRLFALACLAFAPLVAADVAPLALWEAGAGTIDAQPVRVGATLSAGQELRCAEDSLLRLQLAGSPGSTVTLGAGAGIRLRTESLPDGRSDLVVQVLAGAVEVDLAPVRPWRELRVDGSTMQVHVTGTLFLFERRKQDQDYLAMVRGKVKVNLIAALVGDQGRSIDVEAGHDLLAGAAGFGVVGSVSGTPVLPIAAGTIVGTLTSSGPDSSASALITSTIESDLHSTAQETIQQVVQSVSDAGATPGVLPGPPGTP
jgi:hypothetical protein